MKNRFLLFVIAIFCLSGCSVDYHLNIDDIDSFEESISMNANTSDDIEQFANFDEFIPIDYRADDFSVFEKKFPRVSYYDFSRNSDNSNIKFSFDYDMEKFSNGMFINGCFEHIAVMKKNLNKDAKYTELQLSTSNKFLCFDQYDNLDEVTVEITSLYDLKKTNADEVSTHKYVWHFRRGDSDGKYVYLLLDLKGRKLTLWEKFLNGDFYTPFTLSVFLFILGIIVFFILRKIGEGRNKI